MKGEAITDAGMIHLAQLLALQRLMLFNSVRGDGLRHLVRLKQLRGVGFNGTVITDEGLKQLGQLTGIRSLGLPAAALTDKGLQHLGSLKELWQIS